MEILKKIAAFFRSQLKWPNIFYFIIIIFLIVITFLFLFQRCEDKKMIKNLNGQLNEVAGQVVKIKDGLYETRTAIVEDISANNKEVINEDIKKIIKDNKLDAVYASQIQMGIKLQEILKNKTKPVIIVNSQNPTATVPQEVVDSCNTCLSKTKIKVPFEGKQGAISVSGYTETGEKIGLPGTYVLDIRMLKDLTLNIVLTQAKDKSWKTIISDPEGILSVYSIKSNIDIRPFKPTIKERISFPVTLAGGMQTIVLSSGIFFDITNKLSLGLVLGGLLNYKSFFSSDFMIGIGFQIHPFF